MPVSPFDSNILQNRLQAWIGLGNDPRDAALIANGLQFAQGMGDVISTLGGKQQFCPPPPGFHIRTAAGGNQIDDHQNRTGTQVFVNKYAQPWTYYRSDPLERASKPCPTHFIPRKPFSRPASCLWHRGLILVGMFLPGRRTPPSGRPKKCVCRSMTWWRSSTISCPSIAAWRTVWRNMPEPARGFGFRCRILWDYTKAKLTPAEMNAYWRVDTPTLSAATYARERPASR